MLPSGFPEVQDRHHLKRLLAEHVDMQFIDVRTMLRLPMAGLVGGCNFAVAAFIFNIIAGSSVCFYRASEKAFAARGERGERFKKLLEEFYPWEGEPVAKAQAVELLYEAARNPLAHSLGLDPPPTPGHTVREIALVKRPLNEAEIAELESSPTKPAWVPATITRTTAPSGAERLDICVPALYWGVHRMLHRLFADPTHVADANAVAKKFGLVWDRYISVADSMTVTDAGGVKVEPIKGAPPDASLE